jgi:hypothetical protein
MLRTYRRKLMAVLASVALVGAAFGWLAFTGHFSSPSRFLGVLSEVGKGNLAQTDSKWTPEPNIQYVKLQLNFSAPGTIVASNLEIYVTLARGDTFHSLDWTSETSGHLQYESGAYPPWLTSWSDNRWSTDFTGVIYNPNDCLVSATPASSQCGSTSVESGAVLTLTFPSGISPSGSTVVMSDSALSGSAQADLS